jgi:transposase
MCWPGAVPGEAACPGCGVVSRRLHSQCPRQLADSASGGQEVLIHLQARRFLCGNHACARTTFAEPVPGLITRYGRRTCGLQAVLRALGLALGGRAGARLTGRLACLASRSTLLRLIRAAPDPDGQTPLVLGVDDFALRKGHATSPCWWTSTRASSWLAVAHGTEAVSCLASAIDRQFLHDMVYVNLDRVYGDVKCFGNLLV